MMNDKVKAIVDDIFVNAPQNGEARALYEEVLADCAERFEDLIRSGKSEDEALEEIRAALGGMDECISGIAAEEKEPGDDAPEHSASAPKGGKNGRSLLDDMMKFAACYAPAGRTRGAFAALREFSVDGADKVEIITDDDDIRVTPSPDGMFHMDYTGPNGEKLRSERQGNTLRVSIERTEKTSSDRSMKDILTDLLAGRRQRTGTGCLTIGLPESMMGNIRLLSMDGDISICGCAAKRLSATSSSGDVRTEDCGAEGEISVHTVSGDIRLDGRAAELNAGSVSGNMRLNGAYALVSVKSTSGDIWLTGSTAKLGASSVSGDIRAEFTPEAPDEIDIRTTSGDAEIDLCGCPFRCETKTVSGDVRLHRAQDPSARTLVRMNTVSGDIDIH